MAIVTVTDLVRNFADALRALIPMLDRAEVPWIDHSQGDAWDRLSETLFEALVLEPCAYQAVGEAGLSKLSIVKYGYVAAPANNAWLYLDNRNGARFRSLVTDTAPFRQRQVRRVDRGCAAIRSSVRLCIRYWRRSHTR